MTFVQVFTGKVPFHEFRMVHALTRIIVGHRPPRPSGDREIRQGLWAAVKACWRHNPLSRPTADKVLEFLDLFLEDPDVLPNFPPTLTTLRVLQLILPRPPRTNLLRPSRHFKFSHSLLATMTLIMEIPLPILRLFPMTRLLLRPIIIQGELINGLRVDRLPVFYCSRAPLLDIPARRVVRVFVCFSVWATVASQTTCWGSCPHTIM